MLALDSIAQGLGPSFQGSRPGILIYFPLWKDLGSWKPPFEASFPLATEPLKPAEVFPVLSQVSESWGFLATLGLLPGPVRVWAKLGKPGGVKAFLLVQGRSWGQSGPG